MSTTRDPGEPMSRPYTQYRDTPLWAAVAEILAELQTTGEIAVATAPEYVIGYICRELAAKALLAPPALNPAD